MTVLTHLVVREDAHILYGFMSAGERDLFRLLIHTVSGIGPKIALNILSGIQATAFRGAEAVGDWRLIDCVLYVTKEPCPMCAGAMVHARIARVVFGANDFKGGAAGGALNLLDFPSLNHRCAITAGLREPECRRLLQSFFAEQRAKNRPSGDALSGSTDGDQ